LAFIAVAFGLRGVKYRLQYAQRILMIAQILWGVIGYRTGNYVLVAQSCYLFWVSWSTDRHWRKEGWYAE